MKRNAVAGISCGTPAPGAKGSRVNGVKMFKQKRKEEKKRRGPYLKGTSEEKIHGTGSPENSHRGSHSEKYIFG